MTQDNLGKRLLGIRQRINEDIHFVPSRTAHSVIGAAVKGAINSKIYRKVYKAFSPPGTTIPIRTTKTGGLIANPSKAYIKKSAGGEGSGHTRKKAAGSTKSVPKPAPIIKVNNTQKKIDAAAAAQAIARDNQSQETDIVVNPKEKKKKTLPEGFGKYIPNFMTR